MTQLLPNIKNCFSASSQELWFQLPLCLSWSLLVGLESVIHLAWYPNLSTCSSLFVCLFGFLTSSPTTWLYLAEGPQNWHLTITSAATEQGDHDFCLSQSHYTDTHPTSWERAATAAINPRPPDQESHALPTELLRPPKRSSTLKYCPALVMPPFSEIA